MSLYLVVAEIGFDTAENGPSEVWLTDQTPTLPPSLLPPVKINIEAVRILNTQVKKTCRVVFRGRAEAEEVIGPNRELAPFAQVDDTPIFCLTPS